LIIIIIFINQGYAACAASGCFGCAFITLSRASYNPAVDVPCRTPNPELN
jgi:hypothetical protein